MATFQVSIPTPLNFSKPEEWPKWLKRFKRFRQASELCKKSGESQVNTLLYTMGEMADDILQSFKLSEEEIKEYDTVVERFQRHFVSRRNIIFERAKFNSRKQEEGESAAREATCHLCSKQGHFKSMCQTKKVIDDVSDEEEFVFLDTVHTEIAVVEGGTKPWTIDIQLNGDLTQFKIDTGAGVTVIPATMYKEPRDKRLQPAGKILQGPSKYTLSVLGKFQGTLQFANATVTENIYVVQGLQKVLLGRPAIEALGVAVRVDQLLANKAIVVSKFPHLFKGLGYMKGAYHIQLKENAVPFALTIPRRVPIALMSKVQSELQRMEKKGVISQVKEPTDWCAGMVVVPKSGGTVRICVDLTKRTTRTPYVAISRANSSSTGRSDCLLKTRHKFRILASGTDKRIITADYIYNSIWTVPIQLTPFWDNISSRALPKTNYEVLQGLEGVVCLIDDILIYGKIQEEHDKRLTEVLHKIAAAGITLNQQKCEISQSQVKFLGQIVNSKGIHPDPGKVAAVKQMNAPTDIKELHGHGRSWAWSIN